MKIEKRTKMTTYSNKDIHTTIFKITEFP